jgi:hypothetical protein
MPERGWERIARRDVCAVQPGKRAEERCRDASVAAVPPRVTARKRRRRKLEELGKDPWISI